MKLKKFIDRDGKARFFSLLSLFFVLFLWSAIQPNQMFENRNFQEEKLDDLTSIQQSAINTDNMSLVNWFDDLETGANWNVQANHTEARSYLQDGIFRIEGFGSNLLTGSIYAIYTIDLSGTYPISDALFEIYIRGYAVGGDISLRFYVGTTVDTQNELVNTWTTIPSSWSTLSVKLSEGNVAAQKPFYIKIVGYVQRDSDWIEIDWVRLRSFNSSLSFNNSINGNDNFVANLTLEDSLNLVNRTLSTIRLYYNVSGTDVTSSSPSIAATGSYPTYQFTLPSSIYTEGNPTIYFRYGMRNDGTNMRNYTSQTSSFSFYDTDIPSINSVVFNATPQYGQETYITGQVSDSGGSRLQEIKLYYRIGAGLLSTLEYGGVIGDTISGHTNSYTYNFTISGSLINVDPDQPFRFFIEVSDKQANKNTTTVYQIQGTDYIPPGITFISMQGNQSEYLCYWEDTISFTYSITKDINSLGLNFIQFRWKVDGAPSDNNDFTGNLTIDVLGQHVYSTPININNRLGSDFLMNKTYYYWLFVQDLSNNTRSTYSDNRYFRIQDIFIPELTENPNNTLNAGYLDDFILEFTLIERNGTFMNSSGIDPSNVTLEYTINENFETPNIQTKSAEIDGNKWRYVFLNNSLNEGDVLRYRFNASDFADNGISTGIRVINITDIYKPLINFQEKLSNITLLRTEYDALIVIKANDELNKPVINASISIRFGSAGTYDGGLKFPSSWNQTDMFYFLVNKTILDGRGNQRMFYIIRVWDFSNNFQDYSSEQYVLRQDIPWVLSVMFNGLTGDFIKTQTAKLNFLITSDSLMYLYVNRTKLNTEPYVGTELEENITFNSEGFWEIKVIYYTETWTRVYYIDWTAPDQPKNVRFSLDNKNITLSWDAVPLTQTFDIHKYQIHRSQTIDFIPHPSNLIATIEGTEFTDSVEEDGTYYYRIVVVDRAGNLSPASDLITVDTINPSGTNLGTIIGISLAIVGSAVGFVIIMNKRKNSYDVYKEPKAPKVKTKVKAKKGTREDPFAMLEQRSARDESIENGKPKSIFGATASGTSAASAASAAAAARNPLNAKSTTSAHVDDGWGSSAGGADEGWGSPIKGSQAAKPELAPIQVPEEAELVDGIPSSYRWSEEMKELYQNAKDFLDLDNKQSAIESLEILVRKAESRNDDHTRAWAKAEIERIYREH